MTLTDAISKSFRASLEQTPFFSDWQLTSPREYRKQGGEVHLRIDLQLDKWWQETGGKIAVNLWCGHRWTIPTLGWLENGVDYRNTRLSPHEGQDHWWQINSANQVTEFEIDLHCLLAERGVSWFELVSTKQGFLDWYSSVSPGPATLPYVLELHGRAVTARRVRDWLATAPRGVDRYLGWLVKVGILSDDLSKRISLASIQSEDTYRKRVLELIEENELSGPSTGSQSVPAACENEKPTGPPNLADQP